MDLDFSPGTLLVAFIFGVIGFYLFRAGKRSVNYAWVWLGVGLMAFPLFVDGVWLTWFTGLALCGVAYYYR